jgi:hypothetical protein
MGPAVASACSMYCIIIFLGHFCGHPSAEHCSHCCSCSLHHRRAGVCLCIVGRCFYAKCTEHHLGVADCVLQRAQHSYAHVHITSMDCTGLSFMPKSLIRLYSFDSTLQQSSNGIIGCRPYAGKHSIACLTSASSSCSSATEMAPDSSLFCAGA